MRNRPERHHVTPRCLLKHKDKAFINHPLNLSDRPIPHHEHCKAHKHLFMLLGDSCGNGILNAYYAMAKGHFYCDTTGLKHSKETKIRMSKAQKGKIISEETRDKLRKANKGKTLSEETRRKISESNAKSQKGKTLSEETKRKIGDINRGKTHSEETKRKRNASNTGKKRTEESRERIRQANIKSRGGKPQSEETKAKIRESTMKRGYTHSEEIKRKIGEASLNRTTTKYYCNGIVYNTMDDAANGTGIKRGTLFYRCKSPHQPDYYYIDKTVTDGV